LAAAIVDDPLPFGVEVPVVVPVVDAWGWVIFCLERRRVLSDFSSDWRSVKADDWDAECFSIIWKSAPTGDHGARYEMGTYPRNKLSNALNFPSNLSHLPTPAFLRFPNGDYCFFHL